MSFQEKRLQHRFTLRRRDSDLLIQACRRNHLTEAEYQYLCDHTFHTDPGGALNSFLGCHCQGDQKADQFLLSALPPRKESVGESRWEKILDWICAPLRYLVELLRLLGRLRF